MSKTQSALAKIESILLILAQLKEEVSQLSETSGKTQPSHNQQKRIDNQRYAYGVKFVRAKKLAKIKGVTGWESKPGLVRVSERLFGTRDESLTHARRFVKIYSHKSYKVMKVNKRPNAWVNEKTGKTNPVIGLKRTNLG